MRRGYWKTKEGKEVRIKDMTNYHLINCVKMLERLAGDVKMGKLLEGYDALNMVQGEMAEVCIEHGINQLETMNDKEILEEYIPVYKVLMNEVKRRKLEGFLDDRKNLIEELNS